jgi:gliding motility-associated-like protein
LIIYDRWGRIIFQSTNRNEAWDGTKEAKALPEGVYTYLIEGKKQVLVLLFNKEVQLYW